MTKPLGHYRLASLEAGDDVTLSRYVRDDRATSKRRKSQPRLPGFETAFIQEGRTKFSKAVVRVADVPRLLVSGHSNVKIGRDVRKGKFRGYWIYTLSLEERKTCPSSCLHWQSCYGNNMPFARRVDHTDPAFLVTLEREIETLLAGRRRPGILIRLHALGDFYSTAYVAFWRRMLDRHKRLAIYGYTAHFPESEIGRALKALMIHNGASREVVGRAAIRFSNARASLRATVSIGSPESCPPNAFVCPEQTGKTKCCATCGACWSTTKNVAFLEH